MASGGESNQKPNYDAVMQSIADYVTKTVITSSLAYEAARWCLMDALGCALLALKFPECTRLLGPIVPGAELKNGARIPGTAYTLDPVQAAFNLGAMIRWLDFNDTWLAAEWGHPSDNIGAILAVADYVSRQLELQGKPGILMHDVLIAIIKAYEIQGIIALDNAFNRCGIDHVILVKLASSAVIGQWLGLDREGILRLLSQVFMDGQSLRTYRHAPNTGSRKSWAAGDACARAVRLALLTAAGETGAPSALTVPQWGFYDVAFGGNVLLFPRDYGSYVIENILFKLAYPAEFHAQTAVECAIKLHNRVSKNIDNIERIEIATQAAALRIICKQGPLYNPADRDHCLQYMVAIALLTGDLQATDYADKVACDPRIDKLRDKMHVFEDVQFSQDYYDPNKRAIGNRIRIVFKDQQATEWISEAYPIGHPRRREEGLPVLMKKFQDNLHTSFNQKQCKKIIDIMQDPDRLANCSVTNFMSLWSL